MSEKRGSNNQPTKPQAPQAPQTPKIPSSPQREINERGTTTYVHPPVPPKKD